MFNLELLQCPNCATKTILCTTKHGIKLWAKADGHKATSFDGAITCTACAEHLRESDDE